MAIERSEVYGTCAACDRLAQPNNPQAAHKGFDGADAEKDSAKLSNVARHLIRMFTILQKPKYGEPCNRCGICCERELCPTAMEVHRPEYRGSRGEALRGPCPSLIYNKDGSTTCGQWEKVSKWISLGGCWCPDQTTGWQNVQGKNEERARAKVRREMAEVVR